MCLFILGNISNTEVGTYYILLKEYKIFEKDYLVNNVNFSM